VVKLLVGMARNKAAEQARKERRQCRDNRRVEPLGEQQAEAPASDPSPSAIVAGEELLRAVQGELTAEERELADRRARGECWEVIAAEMGGTAQARRKQLERTIVRIVERFGLDGDS
jgi:hypothetical protein